MIDKAFLEGEIKRLSEQLQNAQNQSFTLARGMEQLSGAIQMLQALLQKVSVEAGGDSTPPASSEMEV